MRARLTLGNTESVVAIFVVCLLRLAWGPPLHRLRNAAPPAARKKEQ